MVSNVRVDGWNSRRRGERERNQENVKIMSSGVAVSRYIGAAPLAVVVEI